MTQEIMDKLKEHDAKFKTVFERLDEHGEQLDTIARVVFQHSDRLDRIEENMLTRQEYQKGQQELMQSLDELVGLVKKNDQEITFMGSRLTRVEDDVKVMKPLLGLA